MKLRGSRLRVLMALGVIVLICSLELAFVSEATGVEKRMRDVLHVLSYGSVMLVGYLYWRRSSPEWMRNMWLIVHVVFLVVVVLVSVLGGMMHLFPRVFNDQFYDVRLFFTSPVPFLISLLIVRLEKMSK